LKKKLDDILSEYSLLTASLRTEDGNVAESKKNELKSALFQILTLEVQTIGVNSDQILKALLAGKISLDVFVPEYTKLRSEFHNASFSLAKIKTLL
jgi:hypothetical protein